MIIFDNNQPDTAINALENSAKEARLIAAKVDDDVLDRARREVGVGYWSINLETNELYISDSVRWRLTKTELDKVESEGLWAIIHPDDVPSIKPQWEAAVETGEIDFTYRLVLENEGEVWQRSFGRLQYSETGAPQTAIVFVTDATEGVKREEELLLAEKSSKAKTLFLAQMSHEIRTSLNAIIGLTDAIKEDDLSPESLETVGYIDDAAQRLHQLLTQTLDHAKLGSEKAEANWELEDPKEIVAECVRIWRPQCKKKDISLKIFQGKNLPESMLMDSFKMGQCLNNLLSNAVKFTPSGEISVIIKRTDVKGKDSLMIAVKDTGIGMTPEATSKVFEEFTQANTSIKREYGGTGLGLNITKQLIELMEGRITVTSRKGEGSVFLIILPIRETDEKNQTQETAQARSNQVTTPLKTAQIDSPAKVSDENAFPPFSGLTVLCVEDNPVNQHVVQRLIGKRVKALHFANNGREALHVLTHVPVDIVLMDIHMPVMDGIEATLAIRESKSPWANVVIIALTADPDYQQARICRNLGMNGSISKPVTRDDIAFAFENALSNIGYKYGQPAYLPLAASA